ncbi:protease inhibitor I42 family protein [Methylocapsa palsarum]|uniref:Inhibitor of cysteine peptidase n=1 Tax=Methylocapsa palsarum TaxID=1612308 RepID=A0A1I4BRN4_9HYPH|nr:protease inhibitor I42 family protein [Methylocapsa palsarum]SFK71478.1 inhibitor of cysteine peptidase [Methylocapsa palsarum]
MAVSRLQQCLVFALFVGAMARGVCGGAVRAQTSGETLDLTIGGSAIVELAENPSTGYSWSLSAAESSNLRALVISAEGFKSGGGNGAPLIGAPGVAQFKIEGRKSGAARAMFVYSRPWEHGAPAGRHVVTVKVR